MTDKTGVVDFARGLADVGFELVSTGGTAAALRTAGLDVRDVGDLTGFPEMLDGRVKTLHPMVHGGLLADVRNPDHVRQIGEAGIGPIDLLCVNLYAFEQTVSGEHRFADAVESIDIGGPAMIRAAAKNGANVLVVVDPADYEEVLNVLNGGDRAQLARLLMAKAFRHTAFYDSMIARYLSANEPLPETLTFGWRRADVLRYGENPHQSAALYRDPFAKEGIATARQLWGKELSYNNLLDADAAWELACDLPANACAIIKHGNPCGVGASPDAAESYRMARATDPVSAFGGIAAIHGVVDAEAAASMTEKGNFLEVVIATGFVPEAVAAFREKPGWGQSVRLLECSSSSSEPFFTIRSIRGGVLVQESDEEPAFDWKTVTNRAPTTTEEEAMRLLWVVARHVKSNAIVVGLADRVLGVGAGQMNRVQSVRLALDQAGAASQGAILASDAFFPFPDSIEVAAVAGITAIVQPGGSKKDDDVVAAADRLGLAMVFTGVRHFRH